MKAPNDLIVNEVYEVILQDCCIEGKFTSKLLSKEDDILIFENGVTLQTYLECVFDKK